jgi:peptidylprolyl isomerase
MAGPDQGQPPAFSFTSPPDPGDVPVGPEAPPDDTDTPDEPDSPIFGGFGDVPAITGEPITTDSGLTYIDVEVGQGPLPELTSRVTVNYTGWLTDGTEFDGNEATQFGLNQVIPGWTEGVGSMRVGGSRRLLVPPELGYGDAGAPPSIPGGATLIFDVDLLDFER